MVYDLTFLNASFNNLKDKNDAFNFYKVESETNKTLRGCDYIWDFIFPCSKVTIPDKKYLCLGKYKRLLKGSKNVQLKDFRRGKKLKKKNCKMEKKKKKTQLKNLTLKYSIYRTMKSICTYIFIHIS